MPRFTIKDILADKEGPKFNELLQVTKDWLLHNTEIDSRYQSGRGHRLTYIRKDPPKQVDIINAEFGVYVVVVVSQVPYELATFSSMDDAENRALAALYTE